MAQSVKTLVTKALQCEFDPRDPRGREATPVGTSLAYTHTLCGMHMPTGYTHTHTTPHRVNKCNKILKYEQSAMSTLA